MNPRFPTLLSPIRVGPLTLKNRTMIPGHNTWLGDHDGTVNERFRAYMTARAKGGCALITIGSSPIHRSSEDGGHKLPLYDDRVIPGLARAAEEVRSHGGRLSIILWHGGHNVEPRGNGRSVAPSPIPAPAHGAVPKVLTRREIRELVAAYGQAARRCREAGLDAVEVQTASDYLLGSFLSPVINRRHDEYGGSLENRVRFAVEALTAVREAAGPTMAVGVRTAALHIMPGVPNPLGREEAIAAMQMLAERGLVDWVSVIAGSHWRLDELLPPMTKPRLHVVEHAAAFKRALSVPIVVAGRIRTPQEAESVLAVGQADIIAMARTWIAEPEWVAKIEAGEDDRIRPCMSCSQACLGFVSRRLPLTCVINAQAGREHELPSIAQAPRVKRVAVIGGGPAGMEAARVAALRGHQVTLYEASDRLGGDMRLAAEAPHRAAEMLPAIDWFQAELMRLQVRVRLNTRVRNQREIDADDVIWALGTSPGATAIWRTRPHLEHGIPGAAGLPHGRAVLGGRASVHGHVLMIDEEGGWMAVSLAETLVARPGVTKLTVVTNEAALGMPELGFTLENTDVQARLKATGMVIVLRRLVTRVEGGQAVLDDGQRLGPFDSMVLSTGTLSNITPDGAHAVGDCVTPRGFWAAVNDAHRLARSL
ncbi:MAG: FAD-dependent oxidoreductase [Alphaproteobacteria bacterium]|nr:FAD-dependent oxidoreductase [Alphaproteobacteria bacterium]